MSFDLRINNGDIVVGQDGDFEAIQDTEKLIQDILKMLQTPLGSNVFFPWYGSVLTDVMIGQTLDQSITTSIIKQQVTSNLETLKKMQRQQQANGQKTTPGELLAAIQLVHVNRSNIDPTKYQVIIKVLTRGLRGATASLDVEI